MPAVFDIKELRNTLENGSLGDVMHVMYRVAKENRIQYAEGLAVQPEWRKMHPEFFRYNVLQFLRGMDDCAALYPMPEHLRPTQLVIYNDPTENAQDAANGSVTRAAYSPSTNQVAISTIGLVDVAREWNVFRNILGPHESSVKAIIKSAHYKSGAHEQKHCNQRHTRTAWFFAEIKRMLDKKVDYIDAGHEVDARDSADKTFEKNESKLPDFTGSAYIAHEWLPESIPESGQLPRLRDVIAAGRSR